MLKFILRVTTGWGDGLLLMATSQYLNHYGIIIFKVQWHTSQETPHPSITTVSWHPGDDMSQDISHGNDLIIR